MAFNINDFKSRIDQYGGLARPNVFEVEFTPLKPSGFPVALQTSESALSGLDLKFFCQTVTFPSLSVEVFDYKPNNNDMARSMPRGIGHGDLECVFMVDDQHRVAEFFHTWIRLVTNYSDTAFGEQMPYEVGYKSDYAVGMGIKMYSRSPINGSPGSASYYECRLLDVYPVQLGSITLEWAQNDSYMTLPVSFSYSHYIMRRYVNGQVQEGLLDRESFDKPLTNMKG